MIAASHEGRDARRPAIRWMGLTAFVLLAACGGDRRESPDAGVEGAAVADSAPTTSADTAAVATADTAASTATGTSTASVADSAKQPSRRTAAPAKPAAPAASKPATPKPATPKPAAPAAPATPKPEPPAPAQAAAPAAPAQDTGAQGEESVASSQDTAPAQDTAASTQDTAASTQDTAAPAQDTAATAQADTAAGGTQTADAPLRDEYHQAPRDTVDQATYDGWKQYNLNCARCHGEDVLGSTIAPHLVMSLKPDGPINTQEAFVQVVCAGRPEKGMPSWCALGMEPEKINQMYSYVKARSEGKVAPGRPAVKPEG